MAVIKKGKIHGRIGKYVYRVVNGKEIIQSYPNQRTVSKNTKAMNKRFAEISRMNAKIYRLIKDFALTKIDSTFYYQLMAFIKANFYDADAIGMNGHFADWQLIPGSEKIPVNQQLKVEEVLSGVPAITIWDGLCIVHVPQYEFKRKRNYFMQEADYLEYSISLVHYDFDLKLATAMHDYNSGRFPKTDDFPERVLEIPLTLPGRKIERGLIIACVAIRFFASKASYGYLNTKECNPVCMIGAVYKN